jgi:predicted PurR-regulated permease PerM
MSDINQNQTHSNLRLAMFAIGLATFATSALFINMIWDFVIALLLAAIFSAMANPLYHKVLDKVGGRSGVSAVITLIILIMGVLMPVIGLIYVAATQANGLTDDIASLVNSLDNTGAAYSVPEWVPFGDKVRNLVPDIASKMGELVGKLAEFFVSSLSAVTRGTANFFQSLFILVYAMVYFLQEKTSVLAQLMHYSGLPPTFQKHLVEKLSLLLERQSRVPVPRQHRLDSLS